jgi:hypothetical protein
LKKLRTKVVKVYYPKVRLYQLLEGGHRLAD